MIRFYNYFAGDLKSLKNQKISSFKFLSKVLWKMLRSVVKVWHVQIWILAKTTMENSNPF